MNGHKNPNDSHNYHDENYDEKNSIKKMIRGAPNDTQHQNNAHTKKGPIDCDGVLLTNVQCCMVPIPIL